MSDVGAMVAELIAAGCAPEVAAKVVASAFVAGTLSATFRAEAIDPAADRRRAWDRERKRLQRGLRLPESEWVPLVAEILDRDGHKCTYCGSSERLTADHVVPLTRGGSNDPSNLTACCIPCNSKKNNRLVSEWLPAASTVFHPTVHPNPPDDKTASVKNILEENRKKRGEKKGARLPPDWNASEEDRAFAKDLGWSESQITSEAANFRDYWIAKPGSGGCKLDWPATWRKWVRSSKVKPAGNGSALTPDKIPIEQAVAIFAKSGIWSRHAPVNDISQAPADLLAKHGLAPDGRKLEALQ